MEQTLFKRSAFYRALEILPGVLVWTTFIGAVGLSIIRPTWIALYIIVFDLYWVLKAINTSLHLLSSFSKLRLHAMYDWRKRIELLALGIGGYKQYLRQEILETKSRKVRNDLRLELFRLDDINFEERDTNWRSIFHLVLLPTYGESYKVLENSVRSVVESDFPNKQIIFVLATEERDYDLAIENANQLKEKFGADFYRFEAVMHPDGIPGELQAKAANITYAAKRAVEMIRADKNIDFDKVLVSSFDSDTVVSKNYFDYLTYAFLTAEKPYRTSYQPMPVYNNNIWDAPAIARVIAVANSFWQLTEASRPDRLVTFSSHAMTLRTLAEVNYWPVHIVSDDSRIFWECWLHFHGDYRTKPLFTTVSLDAMLDDTYWKTMIGQYKQKRRWAWGIENFPRLVTGSIKDSLIPFWKKALYIERMIEGFYFWATASIMIAVLGWLPLILGSGRFEEQVLAFNLPLLTRTIMQIATLALIFSVYVNMVLIPPRPEKYSVWRTVSMVLQWIFVPIVSSVFGSFPAVDALTRMMLGKYMGFWVTPKSRKTDIQDAAAVFKQ